jgi:hypothetical protein
MVNASGVMFRPYCGCCYTPFATHVEVSSKYLNAPVTIPAFAIGLLHFALQRVKVIEALSLLFFKLGA